MFSNPVILCPIDLSEHARLVVQHAGAVAEHFAARLVVVSVRTADAPGTSAIESLVWDVLPRSRAARIECVSLTTPVTPASAILGLSRERRPDLLVIGGHGLNGFGRHVLGSTIESVLRETEVPTLVVPRLAGHMQTVRELRQLGSVLAPTDFSELSRRDVRIAGGLAAAIGVPLLLLHVLPKVSGFHDSEQRWELRAARASASLDAMRRGLHGVQVELMVRLGRPGDEIARIAAQRHAGLMVMGLRGMSGVEGERPGSIACRVLCLSPTLLLTIPPSLQRTALPGGDPATGRQLVTAGGA